jgi:hypothetical protein
MVMVWRGRERKEVSVGDMSPLKTPSKNENEGGSQ